MAIDLDIGSGISIPLTRLEKEAEKLASIETYDGASTVSYSALTLVTRTASGNVKVATPDTLTNAIVFGMLTQSGNGGDDGEVLLHGEMLDQSFAFSINEPLFLSTTGAITDTVPTTQGGYNHLTRVGYGLGPGKIFIFPEPPVILT